MFPIHIIRLSILISRPSARAFVVGDVCRSQGDSELFSLSLLTPDTVQRSLNVLLMAEHIVCFLKSRFFLQKLLKWGEMKC